MKRIVSAQAPNGSVAPQWDEYEALARRALEFIANTNEGLRRVLHEHFRDIRFESIDYTGWGFFVDLNIRTDAPRLPSIGHLSCRARPRGSEESEAHDIGLILFVEDGRAQRLEAHGYLEWPADISGYEPV